MEVLPLGVGQGLFGGRRYLKGVLRSQACAPSIEGKRRGGGGPRRDPENDASGKMQEVCWSQAQGPEGREVQEEREKLGMDEKADRASLGDVMGRVDSSGEPQSEGRMMPTQAHPDFPDRQTDRQRREKPIRGC